jgi:hypothetical protein
MRNGLTELVGIIEVSHGNTLAVRACILSFPLKLTSQL